MTLNQYIYQILEELSINSDDTNIDIRLVRDLILVEREKWIDRIYSKTGLKRIPEILIQSDICLEVEEYPSDGSCIVMRTVKEIPEPIYVKNKPALIRVGHPNRRYKDIEIIDASRVPFIGNGKYNQKAVYAYYIDNRLHVISFDNSFILTESISLAGIFQNPMQLSDYTNCNGEYCINSNSKFPMNNNIFSLLKDEVKNKLIGKLNLPEDDRNDADEEKDRG